MFSQKRLWIFLFLIAVLVLPVFGYGGERDKVDLFKKHFLIVDGYIIQGFSNGQELVYPSALLTSIAVLEQSAKRPDDYYQKLRTLYSFSSFQLLQSFRFVYQIEDPLRPNIRIPRTASFTVVKGDKEDSLAVKIFPLRIEGSGMIQLQLEVTKDKQPYLGTNISVKEKKSVLAGRMMDKEGGSALFFAFTPLLYYSPPCDSYPQVKELGPGESVESPVEGIVILLIYIDETGKVTDAGVIKSLGKAMDRAAIYTAKRCLFTPCLQEGKPVGGWFPYPVKFKVKHR